MNPSEARPSFNKTKLTERKRIFDLKFLLTGNSGSGKTHFTATYTKGPLHYYMFDKGGEKTIEKISKNRTDITLDNFSHDDMLFSDFWRTFQEDEKAGLFEWLKEQSGMLVLDSLTNANKKAIHEIEKKSGITPSGIGKKIDMKLGMAPAQLTPGITVCSCSHSASSYLDEFCSRSSCSLSRSQWAVQAVASC